MQNHSPSAAGIQPKIVYSDEALEQIGLLKAIVEKGVEIGVGLADAYGAPVDRACVYKFTSIEDPSYSEIVLAFYSAADRERLSDLFLIVAQGVGEWAHEQQDEAVRALTELVSTDVLPLEFWPDV